MTVGVLIGFNETVECIVYSSETLMQPWEREIFYSILKSKSVAHNFRVKAHIYKHNNKHSWHGFRFLFYCLWKISTKQKKATIIDTEVHISVSVKNTIIWYYNNWKEDGKPMKVCETPPFFLSILHMSFVFFNSVCSFF